MSWRRRECQGGGSAEGEHEGESQDREQAHGGQSCTNGSRKAILGCRRLHSNSVTDGGDPPNRSKMDVNSLSSPQRPIRQAYANGPSMARRQEAADAPSLIS